MQRLFTTLEEYRQERYEELETKLLEDMGRHLGKNFAGLRADFFSRMDKAIAAAQQTQAELNLPCGYISLSLLRTSLLRASPEWQIDFYDREWVYGEPWQRERFAAKELFAHWEEFCREALDDRYFVRSRLQSTAIKTLLGGTVEKLLYLYMGVAKYFFRPFTVAADLPNLEKLGKAPDFFLTGGEYLDWQERLYGERPPIDLLDIPSNEDVTFRDFRGQIFSQGELTGQNMAHCRFRACEFREFNFSEVSLADAWLSDCRFSKVNFSRVNLTGTLFSDCNFKDCHFTQCRAVPETDEYFAPGEFCQSKLRRVVIEGGDLSHFCLRDSWGEDVTIKETLYNAKDWEAILHG